MLLVHKESDDATYGTKNSISPPDGGGRHTVELQILTTANFDEFVLK